MRRIVPSRRSCTAVAPHAPMASTRDGRVMEAGGEKLRAAPVRNDRDGPGLVVLTMRAASKWWRWALEDLNKT